MKTTIKNVLVPLVQEVKSSIGELQLLVLLLAAFLGLPHLYTLVDPEARTIDLVYLQILAYGAARFLLSVILAWVVLTATLPTVQKDMGSIRKGWNDLADCWKYVAFTCILLALSTLALVSLSWFPVKS